MHDENDIFKFITTEEASFKTVRVPITSNKDWNMHEHIERCTNVANGWYHTGADDGNRPYTNIVTPIINVAKRSRGFDVKDIVPYVNDPQKYYKSFLIKKYHPQWARKYEIDTFIDELVESSVVYDLALIKNCNNERPSVVPLQQIAFCDQTNVLAGPIGLKHQYSEAELDEYSDKWNPEAIDLAIELSKASKTVSSADGQEVKTPGKYIEAYEVHGIFPNSWMPADKLAGRSPTGRSAQFHMVCFYKDGDGNKQGITLFAGFEKKPIFDAFVCNPIFGRACGMSTVEALFEDQVWTNYDGIRMKEMLDAAALVLHQTDSEDYGNQKLKNLKTNTILKHETGKPITRIDSSVPNTNLFANDIDRRAQNARILGSASESSLGLSPKSGTPFKLENLIVNEGQGIHEYSQGKIATFVSDRLYKNWILGFLVKDMNNGKNFSEELSLDELSEIAETIATNEIDKKIKNTILTTGHVTTMEDREVMKNVFKEDFLKKGNRRFFEILKGELDKVPVDVFVNIAGKQKYMAHNADKLSRLILNITSNPQAFAMIPGLGSAYNQLLEESGFSPINFSKIVMPKVEAESVKSPIMNTVEDVQDKELVV